MPDEQNPATDTFLSQGQGDRFDRWVEFFGILVMSLATIATAWCAYQAALWGGDESKFYFEASAAQIEASQNENQARQRTTVHVGLFSNYLNALAEDNAELAEFYYTRFPQELRSATDAWLATNPLDDANAPSSPFDMPQYQLAEEVEAARYAALATEKFDAANDADEHADNYVLLTVIFATVLFFSGISGKFQWQVLDAAVLSIAVIVLLIGLVLLLQMPIQ